MPDTHRLRPDIPCPHATRARADALTLHAPAIRPLDYALRYRPRPPDVPSTSQPRAAPSRLTSQAVTSRLFDGDEPRLRALTPPGRPFPTRPTRQAGTSQYGPFRLATARQAIHVTLRDLPCRRSSTCPRWPCQHQTDRPLLTGYSPCRRSHSSLLLKTRPVIPLPVTELALPDFPIHSCAQPCHADKPSRRASCHHAPTSQVTAAPADATSLAALCPSRAASRRLPWPSAARPA